MNRNKALLMLPAAALAGACTSGKGEAPRPNIIFIMTDDHTTQAMSCYGGRLLETPNMDRIADEGIRFDNCYATNALSGPSRACILTGKLGHVNGFTDNACKFNGDQPTFPKYLQEAGYRTGIVGKWHLISEPQGFDFYSILTGQEEQGDYYDPDFLENGRQIREKGYATHIITDKAKSFIDGCGKGEPFCLMVHHKAPHRNWMPAPEHIGEFADKTFPLPETLFDDYSGRGSAAREQDMSIAKTLTDDWDLKLMTREQLLRDTTNRLSKVYRRMPPEAQAKWDKVYSRRLAEYKKNRLSGDSLTAWKYQQYMQDYLATVLSVDESIGELLDYLEKKGILDNTLIVYTSDQGFFLGEHGWFDKRFMYEECQRMPLVMRYPKMIKSGSTSDAICMNIDFAPTFLELAGVQVPADMQGHSFRQVLADGGTVPEGWQQAAYYHYYEYPAEHSVKRHYGIRTPDWKLIRFYNDVQEWELYDMNADPHEMHNLYDDPAYAQVCDSLTAELRKLQEQYGDTDPEEQEKVLFKGDRRTFNRKK